MADAEKNFTVGLAPLAKQFPSSVKMTPDEMLAFNLEHARRFMEKDIDGIMTHSLIDNPVFEFYPNRLRISGQVAVRRFHELSYKNVIEQVDPRKGGDTRETYSTAFGENIFIAEFSSLFTRKNGTTFRGYFNAVIPFQNGKMTGERVYMDKEMAEFFEAGLNEEFFKLPGVERF